jgi:hypothetical protein
MYILQLYKKPFTQIFNFFAAIRQEAEHNKFKEGIEHFNKEQLAKAATVEKNTLPTKEVIEEEKKA